MTGRQHAMSMGIRELGTTVGMNPQRGINITQIAPTGNWNRMESSVLYPKVETIRGPKPEMAPLIVYLIAQEFVRLGGETDNNRGETYAEAIIRATRYSFTSVRHSLIWSPLIFWHRTPV